MAELKKFPNINTFAWDSSKMQHWDVKTKRSGSGRLRTMTTQQLPQYTISASFAVLNQEQYETMMGFYATVKGGLTPFLWLDPEDHTQKGIRLGTGAENEWQAVRKFGDYIEPVAYVENVKLYADGQEVRCTTDKGVIRLASGQTVSPTAIITADYTYYWKVVFSGDFTVDLKYRNVYKSKPFKLVTAW